MKFNKNARVAVLLGGLSKERDVSLRTGKAMANGLRTRGYTNVTEIDVGQNIAEVLASKFDVAMIALHGKFGEDGTIQGILEYLKIPYTGAGVLGSAVGMDKVLSKKLFEMSDVATPAWVTSNATTSVAQLKQQIQKKLGFPCIAKPASEGSTIGLSVVETEAQVEKAHALSLQFDSVVLWEQFIEGQELTVGFLNGKPLPVVEIVPKKGLFDYEAKYTKGMTEYFCPARISDELRKAVQDEALKAFEVLGVGSFARVDVMVGGGKPWVLEINTVPGMTETSLLPKAAKAAGISFEEMAEMILQDASLKV